MYPITNRWGEQVPKEKTEIKQEHDPEAIKQIQEYNKQLAWFAKQGEEIENKYAGLYVGVQDKEVKAAMTTIEEVKEWLDTDRVYLLKYIPSEYEPRAL